MTLQLPFPFDVEFMKQNTAFMLFCPPDRLDAEDRPVLEGRSVVHRLTADAFQACPYRDSRARAGKPMNVDSLKALSRHQEATANLIQGIGEYLTTYEGTDCSPSDLGRLYALAYVGYRAPSLYFCRQLLDGSETIPAVCAVASRFFHGLVNVLALIALEHGGRLEGVYMTAEQLYRYADDHGHLVGAREVCAASVASIVKYLDLCLAAADGRSGTLTPTVVPVADLVATAQVIMELEFACLVYETVRCAFWRSLPGREHETVRQLFATPHCLQAKKMAQAQDPLKHLLFARARHLTGTLVNEHGSISRLIEIAGEAIDGMGTSRLVRASLHERLKVQLREIFARHADAVAEAFGGGTYLCADLDVFFGDWPV